MATTSSSPGDLASSPSNPQLDGASSVEEILALIAAMTLLPGDAQRLTAAVQNQVDTSGGPASTATSVTVQVQMPADSDPPVLPVPNPPAPVVPVQPENLVLSVTVPDPPAPAAQPELPVVPNLPTPAAQPTLPLAPPAPNLPDLPPAPAVQPALPANPVAPAIPADHFTTSRLGVLFLLPLQNVLGPYYLITKGKAIGVIADWSRASPLVTGVKGAVFRKVPSVSLGLQSMMTAIEEDNVEYL